MTRLRGVAHALRSQLAREGGILALSTALGQLLPAAVSPALARLYSPEQFGQFALFAGVISILSVIAGGRYELAILLPAEDGEAWRILELTLSLALGSALIMGPTVFIASSIFPTVKVETTVILVGALAIVSATAYQALGYWMMRVGNLHTLAFMRAGRGALIALTSVVLAGVSWPSTGLILSLSSSYLLTSLCMYVAAFRSRPRIDASAPRVGFRKLARTHRGFARYSIPADLMNAVTQQLPLLALQSQFGSSTAGQFGMTQRVISAPVGITSAAVGDVLKAHAAEEWRKSGHARESYRTALRILVPLAIVVLLIGVGPGPRLLLSLFGEQWEDASRFLRVLAPFYAMALVASPLSRVLYVAGRQRTDLFWQVGLFLAVSLSLVIGANTRSATLTMTAFATAYIVMYVVYINISSRVARGAEPT